MEFKDLFVDVDINDNHAWRYKKIVEYGTLKGNLRTQKCLCTILIFLFISLIVINTIVVQQFQITPFATINKPNNNHIRFAAHAKQFISSMTPNYLINTNGCRIPDFDASDTNVIQHFIRSNESLKCDPAYFSRLVVSNDTAIFVNHTSKSFYYNDYEDVECCWKSFSRTEDMDNAVTYSETCHNFYKSAVINDEFIKVVCWRNVKPWYLYGVKRRKIVYEDYFAFVPRKQNVEEKNQNIQAQRSTNPLSILIVGLDSVSRLNMHRQMPKTIQALRDLDAVELLGYNKIAYNTYPNLVAVLSGLSEAELEATCWQDHAKHFDDCPFLWKNFSDAGYRTIFAEDACDMTIFNFLKPGFLKPPTDYYLRPYCLAIERNIGNTHIDNANICVGSTPNFVNLLQYTRKVVVTFANDPYFALFWQSSLTHDFFDYPRFGDHEYSEFVKNVDKQKLLKNTAMVFMSDHGIRWGKFRQTFQGKIEESLPFVFLVLPDWWKAKFPEAYGNLVRNTRSLTTPFDLHETLVDLLDTSRLREESLRKRRKWLSEETIPRGISWFLPISDHRNCEMAGIPEHYCTCHKVNNVSLDDPMVEKSSQFLLLEINRMLEKYPQCATLILKQVTDAAIYSDNDNINNSQMSWIDYTITLKTLPGSAIFEGTIRFNAETTMLQVVGSISRLNSYGEQSACVNDFNMRLYCYCL